MLAAMMKRRDALKTIGGLGAAASMARLLPGCGSDGHPMVDSPSNPVGITTYVYMMMENRSYDHYLGARSMLESKPGDGLKASMMNPDLDGKLIAPWAPNADQMCDIDPPHGWDAAHASFNGSANDGFVRQHQTAHGNLRTAIEPMQFLTRKELPITWALADTYASADRWFCSVMGPTFPNRYHWHTGTSGGLMSNIFPPTGGFPWPSIYNRLRDKGIDWAYYYGSIPFVSLIANFDVSANIRSFSNFLADAADGTLPPVVYIDPIFNNNDDHPPVHPINGQELIAAVYTALARSPQWNNCLLVVTYDENGGFFDHVAPPKTVDDRAAEGFDQMGFRVPTLVAGPYVKEGHVSSVVYDHTSALRHLEVTFGLEPLNQRTMAANDLTDFIDTDRLMRGDPRLPVALPEIDLTQWPQDPAACKGGMLRVDHPIISWADENPDRVKGLDLRPNIPEYRRQIRELLASPMPAAVK
jgi:phospholipase C